MDAVVLPARQSDQPIAAFTLASLENVQRGRDFDQEDLEGSEQRRILRPSRFPAGRCSTIRSLPCAAMAAIACRMPRKTRWATGPVPDDDRGLAVFLHGFEAEPVRLSETGSGQHIQKGIHLDMQERHGRYRLQCLRDGALADAADAVQEDNARLPMFKSSAHFPEAAAADDVVDEARASRSTGGDQHEGIEVGLAHAAVEAVDREGQRQPGPDQRGRSRRAR